MREAGGDYQPHKVQATPDGVCGQGIERSLKGETAIKTMQSTTEERITYRFKIMPFDGEWWVEPKPWSLSIGRRGPFRSLPDAMKEVGRLLRADKVKP